MGESTINMDPQRRSGQIQDERTHLPKPQVYMQLQFGVSWNQRHTPSTHTLTYMSRNLRNSRDYGNFPRQVPPANTNYLAAPAPPPPPYLQRPQPPSGRAEKPSARDTHPRRRVGHEHGRQRTRGIDETLLQPTARTEREARSGARAPSHERGNSAPPPVNESPWDAEGPSSTVLLPPGRRLVSDLPRMMKPLPAPPDQFRLGSEGMPWDADAWPPGTSSSEGDDPGRRSPFVNNPTVVPLSPPQERRAEDPQRVQELESLSTAMMTVDNGFENQWWYQGSRESTEWWARAEPGSRRSMPEAMLVSAAAEPTFSSMDDFSGMLPPEDKSSGLHILVSPLSESSGSPTQSFRPLQRSLTTRSEELFIGM